MYDKVLESSNFIKSQSKTSPKIGIILGSGLSGLIDIMEDKEIIPYESIPHFPVVTVQGHEGQWIQGKINNTEVICLSGRFHFYEGYTMKEVTYPVYLLKMLGVEKIIVTNAAGGINLDLAPGKLMLINDFINLMGTNPLVGHNDERFGPRFPDMTEPYCHKYLELAKETAKEMSLEIGEGVYAGFMGPYYETKAEIEMIKRHGADAVGMSTVPETIVANYLGLDVVAISCITNMATGIQKVKHSHDRVVEMAQKASKDLCELVARMIPKM
ncbi:MAG TPA: purine-nucleoside phosphorylase [Clostridiales bacterium]|jgi:purine-nucleoside phosphorylase|nr:purine-nucleoside phosphorylase [Clostridiales bacterium]